MVGDARMRYGTGKDIGNGLQELGHETTIAGSHATYLGGINELILSTKALHALDNVACRRTRGNSTVSSKESTCCIDVT